MALLSLTQVRNLLLDQATARLASDAKTYATGVFDRLLTARDVATLMAAHPSASSMPPHLSARGFKFLAKVDAGGEVNLIVGALSSESRRILDDSRRLVSNDSAKIQHLGDGGMYLVRQFVSDGRATLLVGQLDAQYVWGDEEERKAGMIVCVAERQSLALLYCPGGEALDLPARLSRIEPGNDLREVFWTRNDVAYRGRVWAQFMHNDFGRPDWYFVVSMPEGDVLAAATAFRGTFFPVVLLALLLVAWLSVRQIRAMLIPLENLTAATRRISEVDFSARAKVDSNDEFGELARAFNAMSIHLGKQFQVLRIHGEIDRLILERNALREIIKSTLSGASQLMPSAELSAVLLDRDNPLIGRVYRMDANQNEGGPVLSEAAIDIPATAWPDIPSHQDRTEQPVDAKAGLPGDAVANVSSATHALPLTWGEAVFGWLLVNHVSDAPKLREEDHLILRDIASRLAIAIASAWREEELFKRAHFDILTGLPNRSLFNDRLHQEIVRGRRESRALAVLFVDLDRFKSVNDTLGHSAGDMLLCEAASRIRSTIRESDTVSRHGGDEFTVMLCEISEQRDALRVAENIIHKLSQPFFVGGSACYLSATIGIAIFPEDGDSAEVLLKQADTAMYRAKSSGRGQALYFEERMNAEMVARLALDRELRRGVEQGEFELYYQPRVSLKSGQVTGCEALLRWRHPTRGLLPPGEFIEIAEEGALINIIGRWVVEEACRQILRWRAAGLRLERISVNVSAKQFRDADFVSHVRACVLNHGLATSIELEITETVMLEQTDLLLSKLTLLSELGCTIALDDFGTGYSSMAYLKRLPVDVVKIDRTFIDDVDRSPEGRAFVAAIISMAHATGKRVVAEGVERDAQTTILRELLCDELQGYLYSRPVAAEEFPRFIERFVTHPNTEVVSGE
ncbi:MAG: EAL domain-containing protein [Betaproteobacteria bacterium]|nr:EAL domain-containing protein [Betaproteobacteria bacterium]